ncbi:hypothetical protein C1146_02020, partial [Clostridium botulinum]
ESIHKYIYWYNNERFQSKLKTTLQLNTEVWFRNKQLLLKMSTYLGSYQNRFNLETPSFGIG